MWSIFHQNYYFLIVLVCMRLWTIVLWLNLNTVLNLDSISLYDSPSCRVHQVLSSLMLKSGSQSCHLSLQLDYSRFLTPKFLLGWQTSTKTPRDTKERCAVNWSLIVLAHYGVPQWGRSYFVAPQGQYLKARAMEGISREIFNSQKRKGAFLMKTVCEF